MRRILVILCLCATATAREPAPDPAACARLELESPRDSYYAGEPFRVRLRVLLDRDFFRKSAIPLFSRPMDLPVAVRASGLEELPGAVRLPHAEGAPEPGGERRSLVLNDAVVELRRAEDREIDGRVFLVLEFDRAFLVERPGEFTIPAPELGFAYATEFEEDFVNGRRPVDRRDASVTGSPLRLRIREVPEAGRPPEFTGAVGRFTVRAETGSREVLVGEAFRLRLLLSGEGNLTRFAPPRLDTLDGFHVYGLIDDRGPGLRTITYDLAALRAGLDAVPPVTFAWFDPGPPPGFRSTATPALPIVVRDPPGVAPGGPRDASGPSGDPSTLWLWIGFALLAAGAVALILRRRVSDQDREDPGARRIRTAVEDFREKAASPHADLAATFSGFLAALLDCPEAAVISPDLRSRLDGAGVPPDLAGRAAGLMERLVGARYGGGAAGDEAAVAETVVEELATWFQSQ